MYYLYGIERLVQLSTESAFSIISILGGLTLLGISAARAVVSRKIDTRMRKLMGKVSTEQKVTRTAVYSDK
jgi:hypothetical protein